MANKWLVHVKKTMKLMKRAKTYHKGDGLKKVILAAKKTYKKTGGLSDPKPVGVTADDSSSDEEKGEPEPRTGDMIPPAPKGGRSRGRRSTKRRARK